MAHSPLDGLERMVPPWRKRKGSDQPQWLSMGDMGETPKSPTPVRETPGRKKRIEVTTPVRTTILTTINLHGIRCKLKSGDWGAVMAELKASEIDLSQRKHNAPAVDVSVARKRTNCAASTILTVDIARKLMDQEAK